VPRFLQPHTWPLWHHGCDEVSGEVDSFGAQACGRSRVPAAATSKPRYHSIQNP
jgi:hypothetical protein